MKKLQTCYRRRKVEQEEEGKEPSKKEKILREYEQGAIQLTL